MKVLGRSSLFILASSVTVSSFSTVPSFIPKTTSTTTSLGMGFFDALGKAFSNEEYAQPPEGVKATARHILVKSEPEVEIVLNELSSESKTFSQVASEYSTCPSGKTGGNLGSFKPGTMVKEFDEVIFDPETNVSVLTCVSYVYFVKTNCN